MSPLGGAEGRDSGEDESLESVKPRTNAFNAFSLVIIFHRSFYVII